MKLLIRGAAAIIVLIAIAVGGWWFFVREDAELATNAPEIPADLKTPTAAVAAAGTPATGATTTAGELTFTILSERSEAAYFADEKLASLPLPSTAKGSTKDITASSS
jgi:hypothetical protein